MRHRYRLLLLAIAAGACDSMSSAKPGSEGEVRDSAGVTIVRHAATIADPVTSWRADVSTTVDASTAGADGEFGYVADVALAGDTLYVLDVFARSVSVFGPEGALARRIGGPGDGPGELSRFTTSLLLADDTLTVADWGHGRLHHFRPDGSFLGATLFEGGGARSWWRRAPGGEVYARNLTRYVDDESAWRGRDVLVRAARDGSAADTVFRFTYPESDLGGPGRPSLPLVVNAPTWAVLGDGTIVWTTLSTARVYLHGSGGAGPERIIESGDWRRRPPSLEDQSTLLQLMGDRLVSLGGSRSIVDQLGAQQPELLPAITSVRAGPDGTIWVQRMGSVEAVHPMMLNTPDPPDAWGGPLWDVFDPEGRRVASMDLGPRFRPTRIEADRIVGVRRDELGRETVVVLSVSR